MRLELLNFTEEVEHAVSVVRQLAPAAITVKTELTKEPLYALGRKRMAEHILMNLSAKNAFQAMEKRKERALDPSARERSRHDLPCRFPTRAAVSGMMPCRKFLNRFTPQRFQTGTGLGLSVVQNIVTSVGGSIPVESGADVGTTFIRNPQSRSETEKDSRKRLKQVRRIAIVSREASEKSSEGIISRKAENSRSVCTSGGAN